MAYIPTINDIRDITPLLSEKLHFDYTNYGFSFLKRRFTFLFQKLSIKKLSQFIDGIHDGSLLDDINYLFPIPTTELFRDPSFWRILRQKINKYHSDKKLVFWLPELSSNEELFSILIIIQSLNVGEDVKIYLNINNPQSKSDLLSGYLDIKNKELNKSNLKRLDDKLNEDDFILNTEDEYSLKSELLKSLSVLDGNFTEAQPPKNSVFMILFRNTMVNYNLRLQKTVESSFVECLQPDGLLALGIQERISPNSNEYFLFNENESIYKVIK